MEERGQERHKEIDNKGKELIPLPDILENMNIDEKRRCRGNEEIFEGDDENGDGDIDDDERGGVDDDPEILYRDPPEGYLRLRPSQFQLIPGTIFVEYPPELGLIRQDISRLEKLGRRKLHYTCYWGRNCVKNAFRRAGFIQDTNNWTATWAKHQPPEVLSSLNCLQKVNHFPGSWCIGRKDRLMRTIQSMRRIHGEAYSFHPEGYVLPGDSDQLERAIAGITSKKSPLWIMKVKGYHSPFLRVLQPVASSCGRGIKVITTDKALSFCKTKKKVLIQRYLSNPYLINGKKFDLRIYVLVTGTDPLRIYIHREGLTRISTDDYSLKNTKNKFAHLTNYSVNKKAPHFVTASENNLAEVLSSNSSSPCNIQTLDSGGLPPPPESSQSSEFEGFKWSLKAFREWLTNREGKEKCDNVWQKIDDIIIKTIIAAEPELTHSIYTAVNYRTNCSELFGFDIFLDESLTPHVIEVNISPSLMGSSPLDRRIKGTLLADYCHVTGFYPHDPQLLARYGSGAAGATNPFSLLSLSKDMGQQEKWRKEPSVQNIDMSALVGDSCWTMLCMCEDEFYRADSSFFRLVHPTLESIHSYLQFFKQPRFSDHLLSRYLLDGMSQGRKNLKYLPAKFLNSASKSPQKEKELQTSSDPNQSQTSSPREKPPRPTLALSPTPRKTRSHSTEKRRGRSTSREKKNAIFQSYDQSPRVTMSKESRGRRCTSAPRTRKIPEPKEEAVPFLKKKSEAELKYEERKGKYPLVRENLRANQPLTSSSPAAVAQAGGSNHSYPPEQKYLPIGALRKQGNHPQFFRDNDSTIIDPTSQRLRNATAVLSQIDIATSAQQSSSSVSSKQQQYPQGISSSIPQSMPRKSSFRLLNYGSNIVPLSSPMISYGTETPRSGMVMVYPSPREDMKGTTGGERPPTRPSRNHLSRQPSGR